MIRRVIFAAIFGLAIVSVWFYRGVVDARWLANPDAQLLARDGVARDPDSVYAASVKPAKDRRDAPDFALKDVDGRTVHLSEYRGKVVLLDFFATWCGPCKIEIPWFIEMERKNKDKGFAVLGVSMDDEGWEIVKPFLSQLGVNYRVVIGNDSTSQHYGSAGQLPGGGVDALPTTFLIDKQGKIAGVHQGLASKRDFEDGVQQLLQEPASAADNRIALPAFFMRSR